MADFTKIRNLYDQNLYLRAYRESTEHWVPGTRVDELPIEEVLLGGRLAARLGGPRVSRWLIRKAIKREPESAGTRFAALFLRSPKRRLLDDLRKFEDEPDLGGDYAKLRVHWFAAHAMMWGSLRDFERAHNCLRSGDALNVEDSWFLSCKSEVLAMEDRWEEALATAEQAWAMNPGSPAATRSLGHSLLNLGRAGEAAERLTAMAAQGESHELALYACWHQCAWAETLAGNQRRAALDTAFQLTHKLTELAPLADRESNAVFARMKLEVAALMDDHSEMAKWAKCARLSFYRVVLENLRKNPGGQRIRLPHRRMKQRYQECLPSSLASALSVHGKELDPREMASDITFGGTQYWSATEWLEKRGYAVRMFCATPTVTTALVKAGFSFVLGIETDDFSHAVNVVGLDEAAGTVLLHDPSTFRTREYLLSSLGKQEAPIGPKAMAVVPPEYVEALDRLLPRADVEAMTTLMLHQKARMRAGVEAAREVAEDLAKKQPNHPLTRYLEAVQAREEGHTRQALSKLQELLREYPNSSMVRVTLLSACRALGNSALIREVLAEVVDAGTLPGVQAQQEWRHPPNTYVVQLADLLRMSAPTRPYATHLLNGVLRRQFNTADAWHVLGDLFWQEGNLAGRLLCFRLASCLASNHEHYARSYCDALVKMRRPEEGLAWLEKRARKYGTAAVGTGPWATWASALEYWGQPENAIRVCREALQLHPRSPELQSFSACFFARMGEWNDANASLAALKALGNAELYEEAATTVGRMSGDLDETIQHCEQWIRCAPHSQVARQAMLELIGKKDGMRAAIQRAAEWSTAHPEHDDLERIYAAELDAGSAPRWKKDLLLARRVKRNSEDSWAWRELAFRRIADYERANATRRERLAPRVEAILTQCERTAPEHPSTLRARAHWFEARQEWRQAIALWFESIDLEPSNFYSYRRAWICSAALKPEERQSVLEKIETALQNCPERIPFAREAVFLVAQRLGSAAAEKMVDRWKESRADDPDVVQAGADLLVEMGQGRSDVDRALKVLEPAVVRFPYHLGLRFSLIGACRRLGLAGRAEAELREIIRRFPGDVGAHLQLARLLDYLGKRDEASSLMKSAAARNPLSTEIWSTRVQMLAKNRQFGEARAVITRGTQLLPDAAGWRARAARLLLDCGDKEGAVQMARDGTAIYPRGAYLWFLLGDVLNRAREFAKPGEVEACFRKSLTLNTTLTDAADLLAVTLTEQGRHEDAEQITTPLLTIYPDNSPARGRLAWIRRQKGEKAEASRQMESILLDAPWYRWGWGILMDWFLQDQAWEVGRRALREIPAPFRGDTKFRKQRLVVLEKCGLSAQEIESEWQGLLADFPEDVALHLQRYDFLRAQGRSDESAVVLRKVQPLEPNSPFIRARLAEVLLKENRKSEAMDAISSVWFQEVETSPWPVEYSWKAAKNAGVQKQVYENGLQLLRKGSKPTPQALHLMASYAFGEKRPEKVRVQPIWHSWVPLRGARQVLAMLKMLDPQSANDGRRISVLLQELARHGYHRNVIRYWDANRAALWTNVDIWGQVGYCILGLGRKGAARKHFSEWKQRRGVQMWMVTNYVWSCARWGRGSREHIRATCQEALAQLRHDHSAKYLAHVLAESEAILGNQPGFLETSNKYRALFDGNLKKGEYFEDRQKYLMQEVPRIIELLGQGRTKSFGLAAQRLRLRQIPFIMLSGIHLQ
jgi:predicted Zn-dependent protease